MPFEKSATQVMPPKGRKTAEADGGRLQASAAIETSKRFVAQMVELIEGR